MFTYFLGDEQVIAYAKDLACRLDRLGESFPVIWCILGHSGEEIALVVADQLPDHRKTSLQVVPINYDRDRHVISFQDVRDKAGFKPDIPVLYIRA